MSKQNHSFPKFYSLFIIGTCKLVLKINFIYINTQNRIVNIITNAQYKVYKIFLYYLLFKKLKELIYYNFCTYIALALKI